MWSTRSSTVDSFLVEHVQFDLSPCGAVRVGQVVEATRRPCTVSPDLLGRALRETRRRRPGMESRPACRAACETSPIVIIVLLLGVGSKRRRL